MKIALLEVSHWHFPLYIKDLLAADVEIVGISDKNKEVRVKYSRLFNCDAYDDWNLLLDQCQLDGVFVFGEHAEMPRIGRTLISKKIPFSIEKPAGLSSTDVHKIAQLANQHGVLVSVPLVQRFGPLYGLLEYLTREEGAQFSMSAWRFNAGPPSRYKKINCGWMLDPRRSGGGCLINLAPHFIDLALKFLPNSPDTVFAQIDNTLHKEAVEDTSTLLMSSIKGGQATIQTGYNFAASSLKREYSFSLSSKTHYVQSKSDSVAIVRPDKAVEIIKMDFDSDPLYGAYVRAFCDALKAARPLDTGLGDLETAMKIVDASYVSAEAGLPVKLS